MTSLAEGVERSARGGIDVVLAAPQAPLLVVARTSRREAGDAHELEFGAEQFVLRDRVDCHKLAPVVRSVVQRMPFCGRA